MVHVLINRSESDTPQTQPAGRPRYEKVNVITFQFIIITSFNSLSLYSHFWFFCIFKLSRAELKTFETQININRAKHELAQNKFPAGLQTGLAHSHLYFPVCHSLHDCIFYGTGENLNAALSGRE